MKKRETVWVLGASSGLGLAAAEAFARDGWLVVAGARSFGSVQKNKEKGTEALENMRLLPLDVTDEQSAERFVQDALALSRQVDVVCYAAGLLNLGSCEETSPEEYDRVMQTNFIGMVRMVGKIMPVLRKQGNGKVILFSSLNGLLGIPFQSAYTASKHAIEGYGECLAMETAPFGIQVCLVEPGDHRGGSQAYRLNAESAGESSAYAAEYQSACQTIHRDEAQGLSPERLGEKVLRNAKRRRMRFRLRVARVDQRAAVWLHALLWPAAVRSVLRSYYVKKG